MAVLVLSLMVSASGGIGTAAAHKCNSDNRAACNPDGCVEGERHHHIHNRWPQEDESCETWEDDDNDGEDECEYNDIEFPQIVCDLLGDVGASGDVVARLAGMNFAES